MKSLPELEQVHYDELKHIGVQLGLDFPGNIKKTDLAKLIFNAQQPNSEEVREEEQRAEEAKRKEALDAAEKEETADKQLEGILTGIVETLGGADYEETGETEDGEAIFAIVDVSGAPLVVGTFAELQTAKENIVAARTKAQYESRFKNIEPSERPGQPDQGNTPEPASPDQLAKIESELKVMGKLGLKSTIGNHTVLLEYRGRLIETTVHQPVHRIVRLAEGMLTRK